MAEPKPKDDRKPDKPNPEYENFQRFLEGALKVPKEELDRRREEYERGKDERKRAG